MVMAMAMAAGQRIAVQVVAVVVAGVGLTPGEPAPTRGNEILVGTLLATVQHVTAIMRMTSESKRPVATLVARSAVAAVQLVPLAVGSILLIASNASGLYWIAAGMILIIIGSVLSAWVLLIEIRR